MPTDITTAARHKIENAKVFKKFAPIYDLVEFVVGGIRKDITKDLPAGSYVLDVACGTGTQAISLAKQGHRVVGIDLSTDMLNRAQKKQRGLANIEFIEKDATDTGYPNGTFDVTMISFGLHDMPELMAMAVLEEMKRVTKPNGRLYILDYGQPANVLVRKSSRLICSIWESEHYRNFVSNRIDHYLTSD